MTALCQHFVDPSYAIEGGALALQRVVLTEAHAGFVDGWHVQLQQWRPQARAWYRQQTLEFATAQAGLRQYLEWAPAGDALRPYELQAWGGPTIQTAHPTLGGIPLFLDAVPGEYLGLVQAADSGLLEEAQTLQALAHGFAVSRAAGTPWERARHGISAEDPALLWLAWFSTQFPGGAHDLPRFLSELDAVPGGRRALDARQPHGNLPFEHFVRTALSRDPLPGFSELTPTQQEMLRLSTLMYCQLLGPLG